MRDKLIIVYGSSRTENPQHLHDAEQMGRCLAQAGCVVGTGGYTAIMDATSKGAYQAKGRVIAYTTDEFPEIPVTRWHHEERRTQDLHQRIQTMNREGDAFVALWGGIGTLAEVAVTWNVAQFTATYGEAVKPLVLLGNHWTALITSLARCSDIGASVLHYPIIVASPEEAVEALQQQLAKPAKREA